ncbi:AGE family epimerase/isomerase [Solimonas flava]|uniref:AGE family epimerase/isomerase n=1 Tax=Solimonas flava TaxID=415849 RepID=UPI000684E54B|nr:AGE family epimerase/isomerase [Solimonas flava]
MADGSSVDLSEVGAWARTWLFDHALPLWWEAGADHVGGGFFEKLDQRGNPVGTPTRVRVQARQLYVFAEAGRLGWQGPWRAAVEHALAFMLERYSRPDGLFRSTLDAADERVDLYDQAFVLFALAHAYDAYGQDAQLLMIARRLLARLDEWLAHPLAGYEEANPRRLPLRSNPQMHLLESFFAWMQVGVNEPFSERALALIELAESRLIDPATGAIGEYFDGDWKFAQGAEGLIREPGHQFEWAYLLQLSKTLLGHDARSTSVALEAFGSRYGVDSVRKLAIFAVDHAGKVIDGKARLWAQTERLRTSVALAAVTDGAERERLQQAVIASMETVRRFLDTPKRGLWWEWMDENDSFRQEPSPASSLYHLVTGLALLIRNDGALQGEQPL